MRLLWERRNLAEATAIKGQEEKRTIYEATVGKGRRKGEILMRLL